MLLMQHKKILTNDELAIKAVGKKAIKKILETGDFTDRQFEKLFVIYEMDMPYGTRKARTGDPYNFIYDALSSIPL